MDGRDCFRINSGVRQGCIRSLWILNVYVDVVMKEVKLECEISREREIVLLLACR